MKRKQRKSNDRIGYSVMEESQEKYYKGYLMLKTINNQSTCAGSLCSMALEKIDGLISVFPISSVNDFLPFCHPFDFRFPSLRGSAYNDRVFDDTLPGITIQWPSPPNILWLLLFWFIPHQKKWGTMLLHSATRRTLINKITFWACSRSNIVPFSHGNSFKVVSLQREKACFFFQKFM